MAHCPFLRLYLVTNKSIVLSLNPLSVLVILNDVLEGIERVGVPFVLQLLVILTCNRRQVEWFCLLFLLGLSSLGRL